MNYSFRNDYSEGAHINILNALIENNYNQQAGYSNDDYCMMASNIIKSKIGNENADIHFVSGGTQANLIIISSILRPYESVIAATTGHISVHETGAIEATGHKICTVESDNGKLDVGKIKSVLDSHESEHMVKPRLVFISNSTELGSIYTKQELKEISDFCKENNLYIHLDGARLGSALASEDNDMTIKELSSMVDVFYIGGTKNGALLGEAIVINNDNLKENFRYNIKQKGGLLAKGRILGIQFIELLKEDLFIELSTHANNMAKKIYLCLENLGYDFLVKPQSNQVFPIIDNETIKILEKDYEFNTECKIDNKNTAIRFVTSWATKEEKVDEFIEYMNNLKQGR